MTREEKYMLIAIEAAKKAADMGEVPVGAVVVYGDDIIATSYNTRESDKCATSHAELRAIEQACRIRGGWRLFGCELYVTLEPCVMCAGAAVNARIDRVIFGAHDVRFGALGSALDIMSCPLNHKYKVDGGVLADECRLLLKEFFKSRRTK